MVRAPGGQLITRIKTEAAADKLAADVIDHSDRGLMLAMIDLFQDYTPPNAADYRPDALVSPKLWPGVTLGWAIAYNTQLVKNPPKTWMDLTKPEYKGKQIGQVVAPSGGTTWTRSMFERQVLGEDYWAKQAALGIALYPSGAPLSDALVRGEVSIAPLLYNIIYTKIVDGAPIDLFAPEGVPIIPYADGIPKTAKNPNAAKLFMNWRLSKEGQAFQINKLGNITSLKDAAVLPQGLGSQGGQGLGAELRAVREAARALDRGVEQDLRLSSVTSALPSSRTWSSVRDGQARRGRRELRRAGGRDRGAAGAFGLRQDHDLALRGRPGTSDGGRDLDRRPRRVGARARHAGEPARAQHRHGVPVLCGVAAHDGAPERGLSAEAPPRTRRGDINAKVDEDARAGRPRRLRRAAGDVAVGRPEAARGAGAQPGLRARSCCCSTSRSATSTPSCASACATSCGAS